MLPNQCDHNDFILWPLANLYMNDQFRNMQCPFSQKVNFRLNIMLHGIKKIYFLYNISFIYVLRKTYQWRNTKRRLSRLYLYARNPL